MGRRVTAACVAVLAVAGCATMPSASIPSPAPAASAASSATPGEPSTPSPDAVASSLPAPSPSPSPSPSGEGLTVSGGVSAFYPFDPPPACDLNPHLLEVFVSPPDRTTVLALVVVNYTGTGAYRITESPYGGVTEVQFDPGHWLGSSGEIVVTDASSTLIRGTVDAIITQPDYVASADRLADASVTGTWSCIPPPGS